MTFEQRPEGGRGGSHVGIWRKRVPDRTSQCKGPEVVCLERSEGRSRRGGQGGNWWMVWGLWVKEGLWLLAFLMSLFEPN